MDDQESDVCRVCRMEGTAKRALFHPCHCSGSIRFVHQECLVEWLRVSKKDFCELCNHKFAFKPIYSADMPARIPITEFITGLIRSLLRAIGCWLHYTAVALAWLGFVPLLTCRIFYCLFSSSTSFYKLAMEPLFSTEHFMRDIVTGGFIVGCTMGVFVCLLYLREQFIQGVFQNMLQNNADELVNAHQQIINELLAVEENWNLEEENFLDPVEAEEREDGGVEIDLVDEADELDVIAVFKITKIFALRANLVKNVIQAENVEPAEQWNLEELTWERMLGLDGSFVFLEHVFWVVSLNTLFIFVFAYTPYHVGRSIYSTLHILSLLESSQLAGGLFTLTGYVFFGLIFLGFHLISSKMNMEKLSNLAKICYMCIKVGILLVVCMVIMPIICGWWIDICSLSMLNATVSDRIVSYRASPGASFGFHWLFGALFIFYFGTFLIFTKEVLRPGLLWFLPNLNDPDFSPIRRLMNQSLVNHLKRFLVSISVFGLSIFFIIAVPVKFIKWTVPDFLPYRVFAISDEPLNHVSLELVTLQVFLPTLLEQTHIKFFLKSLIRLWAELVGWILGLRGYLLGERLTDSNEGDQRNQPGFLRGALEINQEAQNQDRDEDFWIPEHINDDRNEIRTHHLFQRPGQFRERVGVLLVIVAISMSSCAASAIYFPVLMGRMILVYTVGHKRKVHEMYTLFLGLFVCWLPLLGITILSRWAPKGWKFMAKNLARSIKVAVKISTAFVLVAGVTALLMGLLFDYAILTPLRVQLYQTPITYALVDWAFGAVHVKICIAFTLLGPNWWLRDALETIYNRGARNFRLRNSLWTVVWPVASGLIVLLSVPFIISYSILPLMSFQEDLLVRFQRKVYPMFCFGVLGMFLLHMQYQQICALIEGIKNAKYMVGQRLVNFEPERKKSANHSTAISD
ncbi:unnamed protein product [Oikopleura dioica]|uniref:RING-type E3 ubiquitin transferase n=1 Tax=Oikopleura dioica TaxID=34765 RepID=E4XGT6_OIKDI|nr:unnamed protein product [Oikopleura dioica]